MYNRAKHIDTRIYRVRELSSGDAPEVEVYKIAGEFQPADIFTKGCRGRRLRDTAPRSWGSTISHVYRHQR